jgi:hypothetical protein
MDENTEAAPDDKELGQMLRRLRAALAPNTAPPSTSSQKTECDRIVKSTLELFATCATSVSSSERPLVTHFVCTYVDDGVGDAYQTLRLRLRPCAQAMASDNGDGSACETPHMIQQLHSVCNEVKRRAPLFCTSVVSSPIDGIEEVSVSIPKEALAFRTAHKLLFGGRYYLVFDLAIKVGLVGMFLFLVGMHLSHRCSHELEYTPLCKWLANASKEEL